ncbi:hypothetical protein [Nocardioides mesophilus]|uniref:Uncharacterized protein n=1 Tax=Nocardioides mesophilus TaxID=433659 RepID=A0A7G9R9N0_9ACTN|nr:hypothetical protein [Nocardioides mesophilus]QNN52305.1 hypothetical protein H9L09_17740 [Nocardioides mesophilus]
MPDEMHESSARRAEAALPDSEWCNRSSRHILPPPAVSVYGEIVERTEVEPGDHVKIDRLLTAILLIGAALMQIVTAAERWWPTCVPGAYDTKACLLLQSHRYDVDLPGTQWEPIGNAAVLQGAAWALLALAFVLLPSALLGLRSRGWRAAFAAVAASLMALAAVTTASGIIGHVVEVPGVILPGIAWLLGGPVLLVVLMVMSAVDRDTSRLPLRLVVLGGLLLASPVPQMFLAPVLVGYVSYDSSPWTEAAPAPFLFVAGLAMMLGSRRTGPAVDRSAVVVPASHEAST